MNLKGEGYKACRPCACFSPTASITTATGIRNSRVWFINDQETGRGMAATRWGGDEGRGGWAVETGRPSTRPGCGRPGWGAGMIRRGADFMAWLGGGDQAVLDQVPQERARFVQMAGVLLTTSGIAVVSMIFALRDGVKAPLGAAVILGLLWGVVILNLDRFLVLSMGDTRHRGRLVLITLPRLALAVASRSSSPRRSS